MRENLRIYAGLYELAHPNDAVDRALAAFGLKESDHRIFFHANAPEIIENAPMIEFAGGGGFAPGCKTAAMEHFGKIIGEANFCFVDVSRSGEGIHLGQIFAAHEWQHLFLGRRNIVEEPFAVLDRIADTDPIKNAILGFFDL